jgi:hypothetical protein
VAPSSPLPNSGDPGATLARACLNSGDLSAVERSDDSRNHLFSLGLISSVRLRSNGPDRGIPLRARAPDALARLLVPFAAAHHSRSDFLRPILIERLGPPSDPPPSYLDRTVRTPSDPCSRLSAPQSSGARPARSARSPPLSLTLSVSPVHARPPARAPSTADLISAVGFRSDG